MVLSGVSGATGLPGNDFHFFERKMMPTISAGIPKTMQVHIIPLK